MDIKNPEKKYRPIPFWSWNERLSEEETARQIDMMDKIGIGGYFMHARGGLETEYMGDEWFANTDVGVKEAKKRGMGAWAYDENGWPSGFGSGKVNGLGEAYWQKYLRMEDGEAHTDRTICNLHGKHFYYDVNRFYVDTLDKKVTQEFIRVAYKPYADRYGSDMPGIFTDEPQISRNGIPWSLTLPEEYKNRWGENILEHLDELFLPVGDYRDTRYKFWRLVCDLFCEGYAKQIYEFCEENGMKLTGHMVLEEGLEMQLTSNSAVMPQYEYFHIPGMDWLGRVKIKPVIAHQVSSVAHQLGRKQILAETFALCGHNVSFEELRCMYEGQMVRGINLLCPHLEGYSLRGIRKRDYPPAMYYQQPWWNEYKIFVDAMSRIGMLLCEGEVRFDTLLLHPQSTAWTMFDNGKNEGIAELERKFFAQISALEKKHILFHLGDERILERHAHVEGKEIVVGTQRYSRVIRPVGDVMPESIRALLAEFEKNGGRLISVDEIEANPVTDNENLTYTKRCFDDFDMHYFLNETDEPQRAKILTGGRVLDIKAGETAPLAGEVTIAPYDDLVIIDRGEACIDAAPVKYEHPSLDGEWDIVASEDNILTIDRCDYWFDGEQIDTDAYILDVGDRANALGKRTKIKLRFTFDAEYIPSPLYLVCETPDKFDISVNGGKISKADCGYLRDKAFCKLDITAQAKVGRNEIIMSCDFEQSAEVYEMIKNSRIFESEKNKLHYDTEIEGIFLSGNFGVRANSEFHALDRDAVRCGGSFTIVAPPEKITLRHIEQQGFTFFAGRMTVAKDIEIAGDTPCELVLEKKGINAIGVRVNGVDAGTLLWNPYTMDITKYVHPGKNRIELTLVNNLRNMLGPHHLEEGECYHVCPHSFYKNDSPFYAPSIKWNDDYCFVEMSVK